MTTPSRIQVAIVGAGPIGLELGAALRAVNATALNIDAGAVGSTIEWWPPQTRFFSSPERIELAAMPLTTRGQEKATREEYLAYLRAVMLHYAVPVKPFRRVVDVRSLPDGSFEITAVPSDHGVGGPAEAARDGSQRREHPTQPGGTPWRADRLVLAIGNMHRPRMLGVPGEDQGHVSHFLGDPHQYLGRRVLVVGGRNSAVEAALRLHRVGAQVAISYRGQTFDPERIKYWLRPELEWLIEKGRIAFHRQTVVERIGVDTVELKSCGAAEDSRTVPADAVVLLTGYVQDATLFEKLGVQVQGDERAPLFDPQTMQTTVEGVFVAGTAAGGSQKRARLFIENSHEHVRHIVRAIAGRDIPWPVERDFGALEQ